MPLSLEQELAQYADVNISAPPTRAATKTTTPKDRKRGTPAGRFRLMARFWDHSATSQLPHAAQAIWCLLWHYANRKRTCYPSMARLARRIGCSRIYARKMIRMLCDRSFLIVVAPGTNSHGHRANTYQLRLPEDQANG